MSSKGMVILYTGDGKGKTTAALGLALRAVGRGLKVLMIQFIKEEGSSGEHFSSARLHPEFELIATGKGFVGMAGDTHPFEDHKKAAEEGLELARERMLSGEYDVVILDEICNAVNLGLLKLEDVVELIDAKPDKVHLVLTGRDANKELIDRADLVTEMRKVKHPFERGRWARIGIDI